MILHFIRTVLGASLLAASVQPATAETRSMMIRAVLHDPVNHARELYVADASGKVEPLVLRRKALPEPQKVGVIDGSIILLSSPNADPAEPGEDLAAVARVPPSLKRAILLVFPKTPGMKGDQDYLALVIDDSPESFSKGSSQMINGTGVEIAVLAGEHRLIAKPAKIVEIPPVTRKDEFNLAQTNFYFRKDKEAGWEPFVERQAKYLDTIRRVYIVHATPGALAPAVATIVDSVKAEVPTD